MQTMPHSSVLTLPAVSAHLSVAQVLRLTYGLVPIVAGLDKFTNFLTNWEAYLSPALLSRLPFSPHAFMMAVGIIEIVAGGLVLLRPRIGACGHGLAYFRCHYLARQRSWLSCGRARLSNGCRRLVIDPAERPGSCVIAGSGAISPGQDKDRATHPEPDTDWGGRFPATAPAISVVRNRVAGRGLEH